MRRSAEAAGRDPDAITIICGGPPDPDTVKRLTDLGVSRMVFPPPGYDLTTVPDQLKRYGDEVISRFS